MPLLTNDIWRGMLSQSIDRAMEDYEFRLVAFVIMPEHVHLLAYPVGADVRVDLLLKAIKRPFAIRVKDQLVEARSDLLSKLTVHDRPGQRRFRFWQEGGGYDRNLHSEAAVRGSINYIHMNPVRRELCEQPILWKWSSARFHLMPGNSKDADLPTLHRLTPEFFT